ERIIGPATPRVARLERAGGVREGRVRVGGADDVGVAGTVAGDGGAIVVARAAQVGEVRLGGGGGIDLADEGVLAALVRLESAGGLQAGRTGGAGDVGVESAVHGDAGAAVVPAAAQESAI